MPICGVGLDLVELPRMRAAYGRHGERLVRRICTEKEAAVLGSEPALDLSKVFGIKEAVMKALGTGMRGVSWKEIESAGETIGPIEDLVMGRALRVARARGARSYALSVTASPETVVAAVLLSTEEVLPSCAKGS